MISALQANIYVRNAFSTFCWNLYKNDDSVQWYFWNEPDAICAPTGATHYASALLCCHFWPMLRSFKEIGEIVLEFFHDFFILLHISSIPQHPEIVVRELEPMISEQLARKVTHYGMKKHYSSLDEITLLLQWWANCGSPTCFVWLL